MTTGAGSLVTRYLDVGLALGRHIDGLVDAYYGPRELADRVSAEPPRPPAQIASQARALLGDIDAGVPIGAVDEHGEGLHGAEVGTWGGAKGGTWGGAKGGTWGGAKGGTWGGADGRRRWLRAQLVGVLATARRLAGEEISYLDEVEACYGRRPKPVSEDELSEAHHRLSEVLPGTGQLRERYVKWRESHAIASDRLGDAVASLLEEMRERSVELFGLPEGEKVDFELVTQRPWAGFNLYLGDLRSRVSINTDLPVLSTSLGHLVAHEAYPGHHTEHCRKEVGLVRRRRWLEETIFLVGTPQCLVSEGLADLGLEIILGQRPERTIAAHFRPLGIRYDADAIAAAAPASEALSNVRANAALALHSDGADPDEVVAYLARWALLPEERAAKSVEFLMHPTWRAYIFCYTEGLALCRRFVSGDPRRFDHLVTEQVTTEDLIR